MGVRNFMNVPDDQVPDFVRKRRESDRRWAAVQAREREAVAKQQAQVGPTLTTEKPDNGNDRR